MTDLFETTVIRLSNWIRRPRTSRRTLLDGLNVGIDVGHGASPHGVRIPHGKRAEHIAILGRTGSGKSSLLLHFTRQDIAQDRGFFHFDLHGETTAAVLQMIAAEEQRRGIDLSERVVVISPADTEYAVGINILRGTSEHHTFVQIAEVAQLLKQRWQLEAFGARTEELLRSALLVLAECGLTLLEVAPLLTNAQFRNQCLRRVRNVDTRTYFTDRYDQLSEAMRSAWRDAVLNKLSTFTTDPHYRHMLGQARPTFSVLDALDRGLWVLLDLDKGRLGEHAATLGGLFLTSIKNALFARTTRTLTTVFADELQNLAAYDAGIETLLAESRKKSVAMVSGNQYLDQYPPSMRAAVLAVGTHIAFQVSSADADRMASALGGGHHLQSLLKNLPPRHLVLKSGHYPWKHIVVPHVERPRVDTRDLVSRSREHWAQRRSDVEAEIAARQPEHDSEEALRGWD